MDKKEIQKRAEQFSRKIKHPSIKETFEEKINIWIVQFLEVKSGERQGLYPEMKMPFHIISEGFTNRLYNHIFKI